MSIALNLNPLETVANNFELDAGTVTEFYTGTITEFYTGTVTEFYTETVTGGAITEDNVQQTNECMITELVDQAQKFGFGRDKFLKWISSISEEFVLTQSLEYWLLAYVSETATAEADSWNEDYLPDAWLVDCFSLKTANFIVNGVSEEYLKAQTPKYWMNWAIYRFTNQASDEFISFIENASENQLYDFKNTPIIIVPSTSDEGNELNLLLETDLNHFNNKDAWYYHTTDWISAESIFTDGISLSAGQKKQDFGGRTSSFYLNDEFKWAIDFGLQKFINSPCAIIIYDIPETLLKNYKYLDLSSGNKRWKDVVRKSRNYRKCEADKYDCVYGPQATNYVKMIKYRNETPKAAINKNQLALNSATLTEEVDLHIVGVIIYKNMQQKDRSK
ncbi:hypothetical protein C1645_837528 [Glomus cerebriforme]|uniref:Uncharacterized protein n=1 Tax=Glomus cerebriforme TaxID=658196 RepID=A0A397SAS5_9GLOM|nr:hypothetical protein C1645_837528 [Glomus cerebriforme]